MGGGVLEFRPVMGIAWAEVVGSAAVLLLAPEGTRGGA